MQILSLPFPRLRLPAVSGPWLPLAAMASVWLLFLLFGLLKAGHPTPLTAWQPALALFAAGFPFGALLAQGAWRPLHRAGAAASILLAWGAALALHQSLYVYPQWYLVPGSRALVGLGLAALAGGLLVGWRAAPALRGLLRPWGDGNGRALGALALGCALVVALVPLIPAQSLASADLSLLLTGIPERIYVLIKGAIIWAPLGFVFAAAGLSRLLWLWVPAGAVAFLVVAWPFFAGLVAVDLMQVLFAPVGVWVGLWLGERAAPAPGFAAALAPRQGTRRPEPAPPVTAPAEPPAGTPIRLRWPAFALAQPYPLALVPALGLIALAGWGWWGFPRFQLALGIALVLYLVVLAFFRHAWLVVVPAVLPALDLAPWTGRFFFDESDLFLLVGLGAAFLHRRDPRAGPFLSRPLAILGTLFTATTLAALLVGMLPLSPLDANAFAHYFSHFNALRVGKGFAWGLCFFLLLRWTLPRGSDLPGRLFTLGLLLGLLAVVLIGVTERWQYAGLFDFSAAYRITASFSSMHTGDAHLPAYLALAVPFVWLWVVQRRNPLVLLAGLALLAGAVYLVVVTVTRASFLALALELALLALFWLRGLHGDRVRIATSILGFAAMVAVSGGLLYLGIEGGYFQSRMARVQGDADTRVQHWRTAIGMMDQDLGTLLFGTGLGRFPETYLLRNPQSLVPGNFGYAAENGNGYLLLGSGETLYLAQRVEVEPHTQYRLSFDLKGTGERLQLAIPLCEKHLLDSRRCVWNTYEVPGGPGWQHKEVTLDSGEVGAGGWLARPPVELFLYNGEKEQLLAVDNLSLRGPGGNELLRNGDFSAGGDFWFFKTHDHLAWHIKNLWVSLLFEQGWMGFIAFNLLMAAALLHLARPAWRGRPVLAAVLTSVLGFFAVGLFASPFDAPRLTALFFAVLAVGLHAEPADPARKSN